ncbi:RND transporter [Microbacterium nanhaiense]|uniref:RND transporter n=1 Tax=Microbacterium nanhaiense TaxID=1301026 RepID=A0ABQ2N4C6_9MICO|nr:MMPL family transporter [Microbacterium nanhaiense]GGO66721.1 RND transporter [Microbacterium nanhaiense]
MSTLLSSLGRWSYRHPWRVLGTWLLILFVMGGAALGLNKGFDNSITIPGTEAQDGLEQLERTFPQVSGTAAQFIVVAADGDEIENADYREPIDAAVEEFADYDDMSNATSPYGDLVDGLISEDGSAAIVQLQLDGQATTISDEVKAAITDRVHALADELPDGSTVKLGGDLFATELPSITPTEAVGVIIALLVLIVTFRSFVMAGLPLGVALIGVGVALLGVVAATAFTDISATTPLLALMLGLAVGIDYALFIAARHQDQIREGVDPEDAAARATGTAGSAVVFAGVTVLIALIGLGFAGIPFLTVMGIAASVAVAVAVAIAVTLTPAFLGLAKHRAAGRVRRTKADKPAKKGFALRWVGMVTKHPIVTTISVVVGLGVVALPALQLGLALPNAGTLPEDSEARQAYDLTGEHFGEGFNGPLILTGSIITSSDPLGLMEDLSAAVEQIDGVREVALATPNETADTGIVQIIPETGPSDPETTALVHELRAHHDEWLDEFGIDLTVTGFTAVAIDVSAKLGQALLPFGIFVVGLSVILLMIVFRSIWVPLKAALGYLLSIVAAFGVVAAVFEWGWGADMLHIAKTGPVIAFMPIVVMGVLFGLAMDYEVFLVSRMREDYVHGARKRGVSRELAIDSVRSGYAASARVVTAAAVIMFAVFAAFVPEGDSNIKPIALALAVGIAVDAFVVRMTLVPAVMALLGTHAWWMPKWLDRILPRFDIEGEAVEREDQLADWPAPGSTAAIAAEDLSISVDEQPVVSGVSTSVEPGGALVIASQDPRAARAVLLAIAGRLTPDEGSRLRVAGHLLPGRGAWVRTHVGVALLSNEADPLPAIREAARGSDIVAIDGADLLAPGITDQAAAELAGPATLVLAATDAAAAADLARNAGRADVTVLELAPREQLSEVIA